MTSSRRWWRPTIRVRLTLLAAGAFFVSGAALVGLMYVFMEQALDRQLAFRLAMTDQLGQAAEAAPGAPEGAAPAAPGAATGGVRFLAGDVQDELRVQFRQDRETTLRAMLVASLVSLGVVGIAAGAFGWFLAGHALRPLQSITATARKVADRSLHERIALVGPGDEIKDLADTFDAMLERLDHAFDSQRRIVANASHELRTPLTINRTLIEVALEDPKADAPLRQLGTTLLAVNQRHERLIDGLLTLARSEQRLTDAAALDLAVVASHVVNELRASAEEAGVVLRTELTPAEIVGDPLLLERLTHNLLDNAIRYNRRGGWVGVATGGCEPGAFLEVENTGTSVPPYEVPGLFQPFRRLPDSERLADDGRPSVARGAGLGLSIVQAIAGAHGGTVEARPRPEGGLTIRVELPLRPPAG